VPLQYGVGLSWVLSENLLAAAEYSAQNWSGVTVYNQPSSLFRNRSRLSAGVEIAPSRAVDESFFKRALYRLGVTRQSGYVAVQDQEVSEFFLTAGMGFQLGGFTRTDIAFEYGWRGQASNAMGKDTMMRLSIGVSASELWFVRRGDDE
jgi:hypothetical protein